MTTTLTPEVTRLGTGSWSSELGGVRLRFGAGSLQSLPELAAELGGKRTLLVTDPGLRAAGHADRAGDLLEAAGHTVEIFDAVNENPTVAQVEIGAGVARRFGAELLVALGGGSAMDAAKGINLLVTNGGRIEDYWGFGKARLPLLPAIGIPTTAGTGSDAQSYAVIMQSDPPPGMVHGRKMACGDRKARFAAVVLDPKLLLTTPRRVVAASGLDALAHAIESRVCSRRNPVSAMLSREAYRLLAGALPRALAGGGTEAMAEMLLGSHFAGAAIEASMLGAAHAAANPLTATYGTTHGVSVALMLPHVVRFNAEVAAAELADLEPGGAAAVVERYEAMRRLAGLPQTLAEVGAERWRLPELAQGAIEEGTGSFNPRPVTVDDFVRLFESAF